MVLENVGFYPTAWMRWMESTSDIGVEGRCSDGGIWGNSRFNRLLQHQSNLLEIPTPEELDGYNRLLSYYFVGDDAFSLSTNMMKPFPLSNLTKSQHVYNYRISRACRIVENSFGILVNKFRICHGEIALTPDNVDNVILASVCLQN